MRLRVIALYLSCIFVPTLLVGQFESAEVLGTVKDPTGAPVPKATVTLTSQETGIENKVVTDESGNYDFFNVKVGLYTWLSNTKASRNSLRVMSASTSMPASVSISASRSALRISSSRYTARPLYSKPTRAKRVK